MRYNIIQTENYLIIIDDSEIKEGDWCLANGATYNNTIVKYLKSPCPPPYVSNLSILKKIIAHLPLNNSPILDGVDLLPPLEQEDDAWKHGLEDELNKLPYTKHLDDGQYNDGQLAGFEFGANWGFNKAKEKYKYTDEDMRKAIEMARDIKDDSAHDVFTAEDVSGCTEVCTYGWRNRYKDDEIIQSLSQPKMPIGFECEMQCGRCYMPLDEKECWSAKECSQGSQSYPDKTKTTTNSKGQTILLGKYIY